MLQNDRTKPPPIWSIRGRPWLMARFHRHNDIEVNYLDRGSMTYLFSGGRRRVPEGAVAVFWAIFPHRVISLDEDTSYYCLHIPLSTFLQWPISADFVGEVLHGNIIVDESSTFAAIDRHQFPLWHDDVLSGDIDKVQTVCLELQARLRRSAALVRGTKSITAPVVKEETDRLGEMTAYIAQHYTDDIAPADVAAHVGLHPKYAMTLFKKAFDMTIVEYVTQLRVSHAQRLLATSDLTIVELALEAGFGSSSRFYEAFGRICGRSPSSFRAGIRRVS